MDSTEHRRAVGSEANAASLIESALEASSDLLSRLEAGAEEFSRFLGHAKAGTVSEGDLLGPLFELAGEGRIEQLIDRLDRRGALSSLEVIESLLTLSELVGLEDPHLGRDLAGAAMTSATKAEAVDEELVFRSLMVYGSWTRISGPPLDLFTVVIARNLKSESHEQELGRRFAYVLGDVGQAEGALMSSRVAWSFQADSDTHRKGRAAEALAYAYARMKDVTKAMEWHVRAVGLLDPAVGWPEAWQAALNTLHHIGDVLLALRVSSWDPSEIETYASRLEACSPFDPSSPPSLALKWGLGRILTRSLKTERARSLLQEATAGFSTNQLREAWWGSCSDLAILDLAEGSLDEAFASLRELMAESDRGDVAQWGRIFQFLQKLRLEPKTPTLGLSLCSLLT